MRQIKSLSQLSHQPHAVPQIQQSINSLIINILSKESHCPNIAKNIVKKFLGHSTHKSLNQPIKCQKLSHVPHHSIQKSATSKESPKINHLIINQLAHSSPCPNIAKNIVKNFVGHLTHKSLNQPIKCQKLSHAKHHSIQKFSKSKESPKINYLKINQLAHLSHCPSIVKNIVKNFVGHSIHASVNQPVKGEKLSHALSQICSTHHHNSMSKSKTSFQTSPLTLFFMKIIIKYLMKFLLFIFNIFSLTLHSLFQHCRRKIANVTTSKSRSGKFLKDIGIYAIGNIGSKIVTFLMVPLYSFFVSTSDFGYYDLCLTVIILFIPFATLQLRDGAFRFLLDCKTDKDRAKVVTFTYRTLLSSISVAVLLAIIASFFFQINYLGSAIGLLVMMSLYEVITQVARGLGDTAGFVAAGIISSIFIGVFSVLFVVVFKWGIWGIFIANILARLVALLFIEFRVGIIRKYFFRRIDYGDLKKDILKYSLPLLPGVICWWLTGSSDRFFIQHYLGLSCNGVYAVAVRFASILQIIATIFYQAWQETAIRQYNSADRDKFFSNIFNTYIYVLAIITILYAFMLKINYSWLVDKNFRDSVWFIYPMSISSILFALSAFLDMGYQCAHDTSRTLPAIILASVVNVVMNYFMVQNFGVYGVIITSITTYAVLLVYRLHDTKRYFKLSLYHWTYFPIAVVILAIIPYFLDTKVWIDIVVMILLTAILVFVMPSNVKAMVSERLKKR
jgi:O-antigen/teichoic acid export membrane protein